MSNKTALYNFLSTFSGTHYVDAAVAHSGTWISFLGERVCVFKTHVRCCEGGAPVQFPLPL